MHFECARIYAETVLLPELRPQVGEMNWAPVMPGVFLIRILYPRVQLCLSIQYNTYTMLYFKFLFKMAMECVRGVVLRKGIGGPCAYIVCVRGAV